MKVFLTVMILTWLSMSAQGQTPPGEFPGKQWAQYNTAEDAGFSAKGLDAVEKLFSDNDGASLLIIYKGKVVLSLGENARRFMLHSMRKSLLSALYGINLKKIDTAKTLKQLGIDDTTKLTETELQARIIDLLGARSGIYLPSAYSPASMEKDMPKRGSALPGNQWFYNNWDFNALSTIFTRLTGLDVFKAFKTQLADPLEMEDFRMIDTYYRLEPNKSRHPAYLIKMSSRDLGRLGLLYLNNGKWKNKQIIPEAWVRTSVTPRTTDLGNMDEKGSYGLLWWIADDISGQPMYYASGIQGHRLCIFPESDMVVVHRTNTYGNVNYSEEYMNKLLQLIITAKTTGTRFSNQKISKAGTDKYLGSYRHPAVGNVLVMYKDDGLVAETGNGYYRLLPVKDNEFFMEDMNIMISFVNSTPDLKKGSARLIMNDKKQIEKVELVY